MSGQSSKEADITFNRQPVQGTNDGVIGQLLFENATDSVAQISVKRESAADDAYIQFATQATGTGAMTERLRITSDGNVNFLGSLVNVNATGVSSFVQLDVSTGGLDVDGQADLDEVVVGGAATFSSTVNFNSGFSVGSGTPLFASGFNVSDTATFSAPVDINAGLDVDGQTDLDELVVAGVSTFNNDVNFVGDSANIVFDKSQDRLEFADTAAAVFGSGDDLKIYHNSHSYIDQTGSNNLHIRNTGDLELMTKM